MKQLLGQLIIVAVMLVGVIYVTRSSTQPQQQPITIEVPVDIGTPAVEYPTGTVWAGQASRALASPDGIEGWYR